MVSEFRVTCVYNRDVMSYVVDVFERPVEPCNTRGEWRNIKHVVAYPHDGHFDAQTRFRQILRDLVR